MTEGVPKQMTPNQLIGIRLQHARRLKGWTQDEAAERLEPYLGERWSRATFSAAERSFAGERVRQFTGDDLVAFATVFELPVSWFLLPPDGVEEIRAPSAVKGLSSDELTAVASAHTEDRDDPLRLRGEARYHRKMAERWRSGAAWLPIVNAIDREKQALREEAMAEVLLERAELLGERRR